MTKEEIEKYLESGFSLRKMSELTGKSLTTLRYWVVKHGITLIKYKNNRSIWNEDKLKELLISCESKSDILRKMNVTISAGNFKTLSKYIKKFNLDDSTIRYNRNKPNKNLERYTNKEVFCINSTYTSCHLGKRILKYNLLEYICKCGNTGEWQGEKLVLQVDHINGVGDDNRLENLRFLCPNCHSQTLTYSGKNRK